MSNAVPAKSGNRTVYDAKGHAYTLLDKLGEGGQGIVCLTDRPGVLVKIARHQKDEARQIWHAHLRWVMHQALEGLPIARPKALIVKPRLGYVMELMDGLEPLPVTAIGNADLLSGIHRVNCQRKPFTSHQHRNLASRPLCRRATWCGN